MTNERDKAIRWCAEDFDDVLESLPDALWGLEIDAEGRYHHRYVSPVIETVTGFPPEYFMAGPERWMAIVHPDDLDDMRAALSRIHERESQREEAQCRLVLPDGEVRWVQASVRVRPSTRGAIRLFGVVRDVTERRQVELALRESESKYRSLYHNTPVMMHSIDQQGRLVSVSKMWLQTLGYQWEEVIGRKSIEFLTPESRQFAQEVVLPEYFKTGVTKDVPYQVVKKDGSIRDVLLSAIAERDAEGRIVRSLAVLIDVTELKRAEEERRASLIREQIARAEVEAARELDRLKTQLVNAISHDLRTPLTSIKGYTEFLEDEIGGPLTDQQQAFVAQIEKGALRLEHLLDDLLDFARFEAGTLKLRPEPGDLAAKIREVLESLRPQAQDADLRLEAELPDEPLVVRMDVQRVERVLINLLTNAIKFTPQGGRIMVRVWPEEGHVCCEVSDTGVGIAPDDLPKLFQRFVQLGAGEQKGGTGLGLSISKAIVEAHGGSIGVESTPGQGSTFWFTLPLG